MRILLVAELLISPAFCFSFEPLTFVFMALINTRQFFLRHLAQTSDTPMMVEIERADGIYLYGPDGQKYIDLIAGIAVSALGHNHPVIIKAVKAQVEKHMHIMVYGEFIQSPQVKLAKALADTLPDPLDSCFFVNSGSEAIEGAMKLAKRFTGKNEIIACKNAYHGSTQGVLSLSSNEAWKMAFRPLLPGITHIEFGMESDLELITDKCAAVIIETVQGEGGVVKTTPAYFQALRQRCDETGTLLILDEIQTGFGRTGTFWGFEQYGIIPDVVATAKAMGGGMPLGAFMASHEIMSSLSHDPILGHITTFGGHPVSAAASLAVLDYLQKTGLYKEAQQKAALFIKKLRHPKIKSIRHSGLLIAVEFESFNKLLPIIHRAAELGVITDWFLYCNNALRIAPPLNITNQEIEEAVDILLCAIDES